MDSFFLYLKRFLVATVFTVFAFVYVYVPQPFNHINEAHAGGLGGIVYDPTNFVQNAATNVATTATAASSAATSFATGSLWLKENILDGLAWALAKGIVSGMVSNLIDWINSGFQGQPQFLSDFRGFLLNVVDEEFGRYIQELGGIGSFVCSPFRLDVQLSVNLQYQRLQSNGGDGQPAPTCTLTGIINNIENFISGTFTDGGFDDWFDITAQPSVYTPYGATLAAQADFQARIVNAKGEELTKLNWGDGFLSGSICNAIEGTPGTPRTDCVISKPGKIIEQALSFNLDSGRQSLISADEINELLAALFNQLANQAITGAAGLLGLSGGTYSDTSFDGYSGQNYLDQLVDDQTSGDSPADIISTGREVIANSIVVQQNYVDLAYEYLPQLEAALLLETDANAIAQIEEEIENAESVIATAEGSITNIGTLTTLNDLLTVYDDPNSSPQERQLMLQAYTNLDLYSEADYEASETIWQTLTN